MELHTSIWSKSPSPTPSFSYFLTHSTHYSDVTQRHGLSTHRQPDCFVHNIYETDNNRKRVIIKPAYCWRYWWRKSTSDRWIHVTKDQQCRKHLHVMTPTWSRGTHQTVRRSVLHNGLWDPCLMGKLEWKRSSHVSLSRSVPAALDCAIAIMKLLPYMRIDIISARTVCIFYRTHRYVIGNISTDI